MVSAQKGPQHPRFTQKNYDIWFYCSFKVFNGCWLCRVYRLISFKVFNGCCLCRVYIVYYTTLFRLKPTMEAVWIPGLVSFKAYHRCCLCIRMLSGYTDAVWVNGLVFCFCFLFRLKSAVWVYGCCPGIRPCFLFLFSVSFKICCLGIRMLCGCTDAVWVYGLI